MLFLRFYLEDGPLLAAVVASLAAAAVCVLAAIAAEGRRRRDWLRLAMLAALGAAMEFGPLMLHTDNFDTPHEVPFEHRIGPTN